ncbi:MAG: glycine zipper family protein [Methylococcales bacterium]
MKQLCLILMIITMMGCASNRPVLYPNEQFQQKGRQAADSAIDQCNALADETGISEVKYQGKRTATNGAKGAVLGAVSGAIGGAISGGVGIGTAIGAASGAAVGIISGLASSTDPSPTYQQFVNRCLRERGYEVIGWE